MVQNFYGQILGLVSAMKLIADFIISMMQALLNYFESEKLLYLPPPQQKLIFWFKDNLGRISTTENCIFFPFPYFDDLRTRTFHRTQAGSLLHTAKGLHHPGQLTEQAVKQEIFIENICELVMWR